MLWWGSQEVTRNLLYQLQKRRDVRGMLFVQLHTSRWLVSSKREKLIYRRDHLARHDTGHRFKSLPFGCYRLDRRHPSCRAPSSVA